ncbi:DUF1059 domain-containing protein [Salarchaeum sp. JOR-1]|uniref:DUF1059 domain-containing protein n=1 Tax=Salarchaeum sp. JOR-1 TaxID=2599399 RepID=UPI001198938A|nr:DUF1059 domain-containing protein [Salarchaeum sp. JOR-1]QDX39456.1 DUF1059 domain-containing protein [Salarchaeum sp. JOR-1]
MAYQFTCTADDCAFQVRSNERDEVVDFTQEHAEEMHSLDLSRADVRDGLESVEMAADD